MCRRAEARQSLEEAKKIAEHARFLGAKIQRASHRPAMSHVGGVFADTVLQAGMRYATVVRPRVERILYEFPDAHDLPGLCATLDAVGPANFLQWDNQIKVVRFERLVQFFHSRSLFSAADISRFLTTAQARMLLLEINGIGPKTFDYLCALVGLDRIAVDRHVVTFVAEAGVSTSGYEHTQRVASFAADLLGVMRRDFDAWMWSHVSSRGQKHTQLAFDI